MDETQADKIRSLTQREPQPRPEPTEDELEKDRRAKKRRSDAAKKATAIKNREKHKAMADELAKKYPRVRTDGYDFDSVPASHPGWHNLMDAITASFQKSRGEKS